MARQPKARTFTPKEREAANAPADVPPEVIEALDEVQISASEILNHCAVVGLSRAQAVALLNRMAVRRAGFVQEFRRLTTRDLISKLEEKIAMALHYLDEWGIASASPKDLAVIVSLLIEKRQLLLGEPTQILSHEERKHINELIPELVREARQRGMIIDLDPSSYQEIGKEYRTARVIPPEDRTGERRPINRRMLARQKSSDGPA